MIQNGLTGPAGSHHVSSHVSTHVSSHVSPDASSSASSHAPPLARGTLPLDKLQLHHLRSASEIRSIVHLREEIDLSVHAAAGPQFDMLEKKETSAASSAGSSTPGSGSARSASCPSAIN
jgi:hypothetical protein